MSKKSKSKKKKQKDNSALLIIILGILGLIASAVSYIATALVSTIPVIVLAILIILAYESIFFLTHREPITYEQAKLLAKWDAQRYVKEHYVFKKGPVAINPIFKSNLNVTGQWYEIEEPIDTFPAYIAALLEGKHHEWVVIGIEKDGIVCSMWANKGTDNQSVSINCNLNDIIQKCKQVGGYTILRLHNHPNPDPRRYNTLLSSEQDLISAKSCSDYVNKEGFNWYDFVCARGDFLLFFKKVSDSFEVRGKSTSDIIDLIGITPEMDYRLQKKYDEAYGFHKILNNKPVLIITIVVLSVLIYGFMGDKDIPATDSSSESQIAGISSTTYKDNKGDESIRIDNEPLKPIDDVAQEEQDVIESGEWETVALADFEYEYVDRGIMLNQYHGRASSVIIPSSYEIENTTLPVLILNGTFHGNNKLMNVIISEGITDVNSVTFYDCDNLKHLFLPSSLEGYGSILSQIKNGEIFYFGGTEEHWHEITWDTWNDINFKRVYFNASPEDCINNKDTFIDVSQELLSSDYVPLSDFKYDFYNGELVLSQYNGEATIINISNSYYVNGQLYPVTEVDATFSSGTYADTVCIPEGVTNLVNASFIAINKLYLPKSLSNVQTDVWRNIFQLDTLYYGGSEEQFQQLLGSLTRWDLDIKHVEYNASPEDIMSK